MLLTRMFQRHRVAVLILSCCLCPPVLAVNWMWLDFSPVSYFNADDWAMFQEAAQKALNEQPDGATATWQNPGTDASGTVTPTRSFEENDQSCRRVEITNRARGFSGTSVFNFCRQPDGRWASSGS